MRITAYFVIGCFVFSFTSLAQIVWRVESTAAPGTGVGTTADPFGAIQDAIANAAEGDNVLVGPGTYVESIDFLGKAIVVRSTAGPSATTIDANQQDTVVVFQTGETSGTLLEGFTITNGGAPTWSQRGGGIRIIGSEPTVRNCIIENNEGFLGTGGGVHVDSPGSPTIDSCVIRGNQGGVGFVMGLPLTLPGAGGIHLDGFGSAVVIDTRVEGNDGRGGVVVMPSSTVQYVSPGGICVVAGSHSIRGVSIVGNRAPSSGNGQSPFAGSGGIAIVGGSPLFEACAIIGNECLGGPGPGGVAVDGGSPSFYGCEISGNIGGDGGFDSGVGGIAVRQGAPLFASCLIADNFGGTSFNGATGGVDIWRYDPLIPTAPVFRGCTVAGNIAGLATSTSSLRTGGFNVVYTDTGGAIDNTIVWGNVDASGASSSIAQGMLGTMPIGFCCVEGGYSGPAAGPGNIAADPLFCDSANGDYHILAGSPCIEAGSAAVVASADVDVDGEPRSVYGGVDIGADEYVSQAFYGGVEAAANIVSVNGSVEVVSTLGTVNPFTIAVAQPTSNVTPARFVVWGRIGTPTLAEEVSSPFGGMVFTPFHLAPSQPGLFILANSFFPTDPFALVPSTTAPWQLVRPGGLSFPFTFTLQGLVEVQPGPTNTLSTTNAIIVRVE